VVAATCFLTLLAAQPAHAVLLSYDGFDAGYTAGIVNGQAYRGTGYNPGGTWNTNSTFEAGGLTHPTLLTTDGFRARRSDSDMVGVLNKAGGGPFDSAGLVGSNGNIGGTDASGTLYFSFLARDDDGLGGGWAGFNLWANGEEEFGLGNPGTPDYYGIYHQSSDGVTNNQEPAIGTPATQINGDTRLFVVRVDYAANARDSYTAWLDPDPALGELLQNPNIMVAGFTNTDDNDDGFGEFHFRGDNVWEFDEVRFGTTWEDVTPTIIPEPSAGFLALIGVGLGALLLRRRRKQNR